MIPNSKIYTELFSLMALKPGDRISLKEKRGFTDETIDTLQFKSSGKQNFDIIKTLQEKYGASELEECGLTLNMEPTWQLVNEDMIVIPFLNVDGKEVMLLKSHKFGSLKDAPVLPYSPFLNSMPSPTLILCESEFKAAALYQIGYRAVGLCGVTTFSKQHINQVVSMIGTHTKYVIILFDTEIQNDPSLPSYKDDLKKRYAHIIWSFFLGFRIEKLTDNSNLKVLIATLPEEWCVDGKIDVDTALAMGKTGQDFDRVFRDALTPEIYKKTRKIPKEDMAWVQRRWDQAFANNNIIEKYGCYYKQTFSQTSDSGVPAIKLKQLSNFTINIKNILCRGDEILREVELVNKYGEVCPSAILTAEELTVQRSLRIKTMSQGDFQWMGNDIEWNEIVSMLILDSYNMPISILESVGRNESKKFWVFENVIIKDDGTVVDVDPKTNTFIDGAYGYRFDNISTNKSSILPSLSKKDIDIKEVLNAFEVGYGQPGLIAMLFAMATLFSNIFFKKYRLFPFAFIGGERNSGKTTLSDLMVALLGFPLDTPGNNISDTTIVAIGRLLSFYSSLPLRLDEFRLDDKRIEGKTSFLRSVYNRQTISKGNSHNNKVRELYLNGTIILIGEEKPDDPAFLSRCVQINLRRYQNSAITFEKVKFLQDNAKNLSNIAFKLLSNYTKNSENIIKNMRQVEGLVSASNHGSSDFRTRQHYSIILSMMPVLTNDWNETERITNEVLKQYMVVEKENEDSSILSKFIDDLVVMKMTQKSIDQYLDYDEYSKEAYMYFSGLFQEWQKFKQSRGRLKGLTSEKTIYSYLSNIPWFVKGNFRCAFQSTGGIKVQAVKFDFTLGGVPSNIVDLFQNVSPIQRMYHDKN